VRNSDGFKGTWTPALETDVNDYIAKLGSTKKFGPHLKRVWKSAGFDDNQIPMSKWSMRFCGIRFRGVLYAFRVGSYGYSNLPSLAQSLVIALGDRLRMCNHSG
jgi:hypothetical protein